ITFCVLSIATWLKMDMDIDSIFTHHPTFAYMFRIHLEPLHKAKNELWYCTKFILYIMHVSV
ncbi:hypothetical protein ACJX0J_023761, partial [Zea mays]